MISCSNYQTIIAYSILIHWTFPIYRLSYTFHLILDVYNMNVILEIIQLLKDWLEKIFLFISVKTGRNSYN